MAKANPGIPIYGGEHDNVEGCTHPLKDKDTVPLFDVETGIQI